METRREQEDIELLKATARLSSRSLALVLGTLCGAALFVATNWLVLKGGPPGPDGAPIIGPNLSLLNQYFLGYSVSFVGSLIGFAWAFALGAIAGAILGHVHNYVVTVEEEPGIEK